MNRIVEELKFVVFRLDNIKCMKYNFYSAPQEIK